MVRATAISGLEWMILDQVLADDSSLDQMLLDDPFEYRRIAGAVPRAVGIDDRDRSAFADSKTVGFRAQDAALVGQPELLEPALQELPGGEASLLRAAL